MVNTQTQQFKCVMHEGTEEFRYSPFFAFRDVAASDSYCASGGGSLEMCYEAESGEEKVA